jgi:membrane-bound ClpP family serine protease
MSGRSLFLALVTASFLAPGLSAQQQYVYHVPIRGTFDLNTLQIVRRAIESADNLETLAIILDLATEDGRMDYAQLMVGELEAAPVPVFAFVNSRALGPGALVALATDSIFMGPESSLGAAEEEENSGAALRAVRTAFGQVAGRHGRDEQIAEAMVDKEIVIRGLVSGRERLRLDADAAERSGVAAGSVADLAELLTAIGLGDAEAITVDREWTATTVVVNNLYWGDVRIYLTRSSSRVRLGTVTSMNTVSFEVPPGQLGEGGFIRVLAEVIGESERITTQEVRVQPGLVIEWNIATALSHSNMMYYVR